MIKTCIKVTKQILSSHTSRFVIKKLYPLNHKSQVVGCVERGREEWSTGHRKRCWEGGRVGGRRNGSKVTRDCCVLGEVEGRL